MGGELVIHILTAGETVCRSAKELILQPQSEVSKVREYVRNTGYKIVDEDMMLEDGKYYPMFRCVPVSYTHLDVYKRQEVYSCHRNLIIILEMGLQREEIESILYLSLIHIFPADEDKTLDLGRLGEACKRFKAIYEEADSSSLLLMNESFSTTSFEEGYYIAKDSVRDV